MQKNGLAFAICTTAAFAVGALLPTAAHAQLKRVISGTSKGINWSAGNMIVGVNSTATVFGGGDPLYFANKPQYSGVATLIMEYADGGAFICTGSLANSRRIVTAGHCVSGGFGTEGPAKVTAFFSDSTDPDFVRYAYDPVTDSFVARPGAVAVEVGYIAVNPGYTGEVIDPNDIAVLSLNTAAPSFAKSYGFYFDDDLQYETFNVVGNGARSDGGGDIGANLGTGRMRQGDNIYDYSLGDPLWDGFWEGFFGTADISDSWLSDFDNSSPFLDAEGDLFVGADTGCIVGVVLTGTLFGCTPFLGDIEVGVAGGDSGGPQFLNGRLSSITSYGLTFGPDFGDIYCAPNPAPPPTEFCLNSSFGEFSGYVPIYKHRDWLKSVVPEPASWAMMITGFGLVGGMARRRRRTAAAWTA